ncbi:MAG: inositol monophosphatase [Armatimonadetes bacterium]|nr:inositol monophosphatase [Armatimonadota bacterium]
MTPVEAQAVLDQVTDIARRAGAIALRYYRGDVADMQAERKSDSSWVTCADRAVEQAVRDELERAFPHDSQLGEEMGRRGMLDAKRVWVIDPIDGTTNFVHRMPIWCIAIGLMEAGEPVLGVLYQPVTNEMFKGAVGLGAWLNGEPLRVWDDRTPWQRTDPIAFSPHLMQAKLRFPAAIRPRCLGSAQMHFAMVASGACRGGMWQGDYLWDIVAGAALVLAAGGRITNLAGFNPNLAALLDGRVCDEGIIACGEHSLDVMRDAARPVVGERW